MAALVYCRSCSASSVGGTVAKRRAMARNCCVGVLAPSALTALSTAALSSDSVARRRAILPRQICVSQPPPGDGRCHFAEPDAIVVFAFIEPEDLFVEICIKVNRVNADVGSLEGPFKQAPKILDIVGVNVAAYELDGVVYRFMRVGIGEGEVGFQCVGVHGCARLDVSADLRSQRTALHVRDVRCLCGWSGFRRRARQYRERQPYRSRQSP